MKYFTDGELKCRCCGEQKMNDEFMVKVIAMREELGFPFKVTSAYRCPSHNSKVSSTGTNGPHTTGRSIDIAVDRDRAYQFIECALRAGMTGIGVNQRGASRFIHIDDLEVGRPTIWSY